VEVVENRKKRGQKIELSLLASVFEGFHKAGAHFCRFFFKICFSLVKFCLYTDKLGFGRLAPFNFSLQPRFQVQLARRSHWFLWRLVIPNALAIGIKSPLVIEWDRTGPLVQNIFVFDLVFTHLSSTKHLE